LLDSSNFFFLTIIEQCKKKWVLRRVLEHSGIFKSEVKKKHAKI
jgi:hypothetical protein